ncbi:phage terminase large subunit [Vibrio crassostreae]|uniref:terminase large subunit domain-containing protein n=1 Tax=Vibrio crassostreae TaxID=246167 RepID=UPI001B310D84|nr:terminase family protein [Vibrio crassostreae]CAK1924913.1 phage terminase large subunit [Vibrio crassostreae]CAK2309311.1 phage terminase large subunit [Vibrio crassostreae]CAK2326419.1 phage terminase large subunit [Vibrio crassostreae]CAK3240366.1 phage terminase large subunit [Vibrio crassostreae]
MNLSDLTPEQINNAIASMGVNEKKMFIGLLEKKNKYETENKMKHFKPYPFQQRFMSSGGKDGMIGRGLMAANQIGKTLTGAMETAYHLTGWYPEDWKGKVFSKPTLCWVVGISLDSTRRVLQKELFGTSDARIEGLIGTGTIPKDAIVHMTKDGDRIKEAQIKFVPNGDFAKTQATALNIATIVFAASEQGEHSFMGGRPNFIWMDEEPKLHSDKLYSQFVTRVTNTEGQVMLTFTPENGKTPLVTDFMENKNQKSRYFQNATWDDAPHITPERRAALLENIPEWQRDMRSKGIPVRGSGLIFPIDPSQYLVDEFELPEHWLRINSIDFGFSHPTVWSKLAYDQQNDIIYLVFQQGFIDQTPDQISPVIKALSGGVKTVWPQDGNVAEKGSGDSVRQMYERNGVVMHYTSFKNPDGSILVEIGCTEILSRMTSGRFKVFKSCKLFVQDAQNYHRDDDGKINKKGYDPDYIDSARYGAMSIQRYGVTAIEAMSNPSGWLSQTSLYDQMMDDD